MTSLEAPPKAGLLYFCLQDLIEFYRKATVTAGQNTLLGIGPKMDGAGDPKWNKLSRLYLIRRIDIAVSDKRSDRWLDIVDIIGYIIIVPKFTSTFFNLP